MIAPQAPGQFGIADSPFLTLEEGARYCRFDDCRRPVVCFRQWLRRQGIPVVRRGRGLLIDRRVLDAVLTDGSRGRR